MAVDGSCGCGGERCGGVRTPRPASLAPARPARQVRAQRSAAMAKYDRGTHRVGAQLGVIQRLAQQRAICGRACTSDWHARAGVRIVGCLAWCSAAFHSEHAAQQAHSRPTACTACTAGQPTRQIFDLGLPARALLKAHRIPHLAPQLALLLGRHAPRHRHRGLRHGGDGQARRGVSQQGGRRGGQQVTASPQAACANAS